jgi:hypothetical protein
MQLHNIPPEDIGKPENHTKGIRLSAPITHCIKQTFQACFLEKDHLWLFGSRANLAKRGGDIDLYIETQLQPLQKAIEAKNKFYLQLIKTLGEQKIDIVINNNPQDHRLIYTIAQSEGIQLI